MAFGIIDYSLPGGVSVAFEICPNYNTSSSTCECPTKVVKGVTVLVTDHSHVNYPNTGPSVDQTQDQWLRGLAVQALRHVKTVVTINTPGAIPGVKGTAE